MFMQSDVAFVPWYRRNHGVDLSTYTTRQIWKYVHDLDINSPETRMMMGAFMSSEEFANAPAFEGAADVLADLGRRNRLAFITSRPLNRFDHLEPVTIRWIERNLPGVTSPVTLIQAFSHDMPDPRLPSKGEICHSEGVDILIDNSLDHAKDCVANGTKVVLFDPEKEYLNLRLPQGVERVMHWIEVPGAISRLLQAPWKPGDQSFKSPWVLWSHNH